MNFIKSILNGLYEGLQLDSWLKKNIKSFYNYERNPGVISLFPSVLVFPTGDTEIPRTMPVRSSGRYVEYFFNIVCFTKAMNIKTAQVGTDTELGIYDITHEVKRVLFELDNLKDLFFWSEISSTEYGITEYNQTDFLPTSKISYVAKRKI